MSRGRAETASLERPITAQGQLLVEGRVPEMFFREMATAYGLHDGVDVRTFGDVSKENLQTYLEMFTQKVAFKERVHRLAIVRDAETQPAASAFQSVQAALRGVQLPVPEGMDSPAGDPSTLSVRVFILPNCRDAGMLEDLCLTAVAESDPHGPLQCVEEFFVCLEKRGRTPVKPSKARFAGYALAKDVIDPQLGRAAQQGAIPWNAGEFENLRCFLHWTAGRPQQLGA